MIRIFSLLVLMTYSYVFAQPIRENTIVDDYLQQKISALPESYHQLVILLKDKVDVLAMNTGLYERNATLEERSYEIITALKAKAAHTQPALLDFIQNLAGIKRKTIESYWINNSIFVYGNAQAVEALSKRNDIEYIGLYIPPTLDKSDSFDCRPEELMGANGHEPGLDAINAPAMWALGYTGANTKILILDSGTELSHPALSDNYWGNQVGHELAWYAPGSPYDSPQDCDDHGTHVTGITAGLDRTTHDTIGVAPNAWWMASPGIRSAGTPCEGISGPNAVNIFQWALDPDGNPSTVDDRPDVINNSWGAEDSTFSCSHPTQSAINALEAAGIALVFSAGNDTFSTTISPPANFNSSLVNTFAVGSVDINQTGYPKSTFSSQGPTTCTGSGSFLIKPEVTAPGWPIRSASKNGNYMILGGTSQSAPHASGALLLLKEAFPSLTGEQLKLALYNSATDLGTPGEDNQYGMGLIDVHAAYNYLISQGHTPTTPPHVNNAFLSFDPPKELCSLNPQHFISITNVSPTTLNSIKVEYRYSDGTTGVTTWSGILSSGSSTDFALPAHTFSSTGTYELEVELTEINGNAPYIRLNNIASGSFLLFEDPGITLSAANTCPGASPLLKADFVDPTNKTIHWYDEATGGDYLGQGAIFISEPIIFNTQFFGAPAGKQEIGADFSTSINGLTFLADESYLKFDAFSPFIISSVKVNSILNGSREIQLRDANDSVLATKTVDIPVGEFLVELNFDVPIGSGLKLGLAAGSTASLLSASSGYQFPYEIPAVMSITGSNNGFYPFFYEWDVSWEFPCERIPVTANVSSGTTRAKFAVSDTFVTGGQNVVFTDQSTNANAWFWDFGDGTNSTDQNPAHVFNEKGSYTVTLQATGSGNCSDASSRTVNVATNTALEDAWQQLGAIQVYPNPNDGLFTIDLDLFQPKNVNIQLTDMLGNQVLIKKAGIYQHDKIFVDLSTQSNGIYLLKLDLEGISFIEKIVNLKK